MRIPASTVGNPLNLSPRTVIPESRSVGAGGVYSGACVLNALQATEAGTVDAGTPPIFSEVPNA